MKRHEMFWLPNLMTGMNLFFGFWAIIMMIEGHYLTACWFIMIATICDGLDGKLARMIKTSSEFGVEMDSLCDVVSFGLAPSVLLWVTSFHKFGFLGVVLSALPLIFGMIRLARYNLTAATGEKKPFYQGLPIPMQANTLAAFIIFNHAVWGEIQLELLLIPLTFFLAFLMVSHVPYEAMPRLGLHDAWHKPWKLIIILALIAIIAKWPRQAFFPIISLYVLRGLVIGIFGLTPAEEEEELEREEVKIKR
jgi:CDP-diacylglycerol---serine O-phosphatidyltransferase